MIKLFDIIVAMAILSISAVFLYEPPKDAVDNRVVDNPHVAKPSFDAETAALRNWCFSRPDPVMFRRVIHYKPTSKT
jgi:hypothetical protein